MSFTLILRHLVRDPLDRGQRLRWILLALNHFSPYVPSWINQSSVPEDLSWFWRHLLYIWLEFIGFQEPPHPASALFPVTNVLKPFLFIKNRHGGQEAHLGGPDSCLPRGKNSPHWAAWARDSGHNHRGKTRFPTVSRGTVASEQSCLHPIRKPSLSNRPNYQSAAEVQKWCSRLNRKQVRRGYPAGWVALWQCFTVRFLDHLLLWFANLELLADAFNVWRRKLYSLSSDSRCRAISIIFISGSATWFLGRESGGGREEGECNRRGRIF